MVTVIQERDQQNPWASIAEKGVDNLIKGYTERSDEMALKRSIESLGNDADPRDVLKAIMGTNTYGREAKDSAIKNYVGVENFNLAQKKAANEEKRMERQERVQDAQTKIVQARENRAARELELKEEAIKDKKIEKEADKAAVKDIVGQLGLSEEEQNALQDISKSDAIKLLAKKFEGEGQFDKDVAKLNAQKYLDLTADVKKSESTIEALDWLDKKIDSLGVSGWISGSLGLSKDAAEAESVGFTTIEPIFKLLNPGGGILAAYKVKEAQNKFAVKASDSPWLKKAKVTALKRFAEQGLERSKDQLELIKKYKGKPPPDVMEKFNKETDTLGDAALDYDLTSEPVDIGIDPSEYKGKTITGPGGRYYSDGSTWVRK
jgi:hypothetical protein